MSKDPIYGEIPVETFLELCIPRSRLKTIEKNFRPKLNVTAIPKNPGEKEESKMYTGFADAVRTSTFCASFFADYSSKYKEKRDYLKDRSLANGGLFRRRAIIVEMKPERCLDPFDMGMKRYKFSEVENEVFWSQKENDRQRNLHMHCVTSIMSLQHRTHVFSISIVGHYARLLRWDRAAVVVSEAFDYHKDSSHLAEFLLRYEHATPEQRGHEFMATEATAQEVTLLLDGAEAFLKTHMAEECLEDLQKSISSPARTYKLRIPIGSTGLAWAGCYEYREYIVRRPFVDGDELFGRATKGYLAWGCSEKKVVFLKDAWRSNLRQLPEVAGDSESQHTQSIDLIHHGRNWPSSADEYECRVHHRIAQDWGMSLSMARNSKHVIRAIRNAGVCTLNSNPERLQEWEIISLRHQCREHYAR